ncbi:MAG TPA: hypothetical protein ENJ54_01215 [Chloroflexi bacterium]|nr:hypothetical protein [Chloroflexota bacterium]
MAKRLHTPKAHQPKPQQPRKRPRPRGWHDWIEEKRREAESGKRSHGRAVVHVVKEPLPQQKYNRAKWRKMTVAERVDAIAERLGLLEPPAVDG